MAEVAPDPLFLAHVREALGRFNVYTLARSSGGPARYAVFAGGVRLTAGMTHAEAQAARTDLIAAHLWPIVAASIARALAERPPR